MSSPDSAQERFYKKDMPEIGDLVMVKVTQVNDTSAYVHLLEYNNMEGMIPYGELSRRRIRSIGKHVRVGKMEVAQVIRLDRTKGYIDLSKKQVTPAEHQVCEERFSKAKVVHGIMRHAASDLGIPFMDIQENVTWPLYTSHGHAHNALKLAVANPEAVFAALNMPPVPAKLLNNPEYKGARTLREHLELQIKHKLKAQAAKIRADVNVTCYKREGIDAIRAVLRHGAAEGLKEPALPIQITISAPPLYVIRSHAENRDEGLKKLRDIIDSMRALMQEKGGHVEIVHAPRVVGEDGEDLHGEDHAEAQSSDDEGPAPAKAPSA